MLFRSDVTVTMNLIHVDRAVLDVCLQEAMGGAAAVGALVRAGTRLGGNNARFAAGNHFISLNISSPITNKPWRFPYAFMTGPAAQFPLGTEKSVFVIQWRAIPYTQDPWNAGLGSAGAIIWDHTSD